MHKISPKVLVLFLTGIDPTCERFRIVFHLQQVKELKKSRDQANKAKEELDLKKRFFERKKNEMEKENQLLKATNVRF